jgi:hypothetical protein
MGKNPLFQISASSALSAFFRETLKDFKDRGLCKSLLSRVLWEATWTLRPLAHRVQQTLASRRNHFRMLFPTAAVRSNTARSSGEKLAIGSTQTGCAFSQLLRHSNSVLHSEIGIPFSDPVSLFFTCKYGSSSVKLLLISSQKRT